MNKQLSIKQVQEILNWSYPTALEFAKSNGSMIDGKWLIPAEIVQQVINSRLMEVEKTARTFESFVSA